MYTQRDPVPRPVRSRSLRPHTPNSPTSVDIVIPAVNESLQNRGRAPDTPHTVRQLPHRARRGITGGCSLGLTRASTRCASLSRSSRSSTCTKPHPGPQHSSLGVWPYKWDIEYVGKGGVGGMDFAVGAAGASPTLLPPAVLCERSRSGLRVDPQLRLKFAQWLASRWVERCSLMHHGDRMCLSVSSLVQGSVPRKWRLQAVNVGTVYLPRDGFRHGKPARRCCQRVGGSGLHADEARRLHPPHLF